MIVNDTGAINGRDQLRLGVGDGGNFCVHIQRRVERHAPATEQRKLVRVSGTRVENIPPFQNKCGIHFLIIAEVLGCRVKAKINININLEIGDFRMETSLGPTLAEFMHGPKAEGM